MRKRKEKLLPKLNEKKNSVSYVNRHLSCRWDTNKKSKLIKEWLPKMWDYKHSYISDFVDPELITYPKS